MSICWKQGKVRLNMIENLEINPLFKEELKMAEYEDNRTLKELFTPISTSPPSCIVLPATTAVHFELKPHVIQLLPTFNDLEIEDPYLHIKTF